MNLDLHQLKDVLERAISTYVQSVVGLIAASGMADLDLSTIKVIAVSAAPAALSIIKGYVASVLPLGDKSASVIAMGKPAGSEADSGMYD
jgi:hypothetical protein